MPAAWDNRPGARENMKGNGSSRAVGANRVEIWKS